MGLGAWLESALPDLGTNSTNVKPINEGEPVTIVEDQPSEGGFWGWLDGIGDTVTDGVGTYVHEKLKDEFTKQTYGAEKSQDTTGDPNYQAGVVGKPVQLTTEPAFGEKYRTELLVAAGVLTSLLVASMLMRR